MTPKEIADELFQAGKEVKRCFLQEAAVYHRTPSERQTAYSQYITLLNHLKTMYDSLNYKAADTIDITPLPDTVCCLGSTSQERLFIDRFLSILNILLFNTIKFRRNICLVRRNDRTPGLASHIITNLGQIIAAIHNGYLPVIDTVYADNMFTELSRTYSSNAWELYFKQPFAISLADIAVDEEVSVLDGIPSFMPNYNMDCLMNPGLITFWREIAQKYLIFSPELEQSIAQCLNHLPFDSDRRILGVLCRGTDYTNLRPYNHPVQPSPEMVLEKSQKYMEKYQCEYCYLATEDRGILQLFRSVLKEQLLTTQEIYYSSDLGEIINQFNSTQAIDLHRKNAEYLTALVLLSKCQYFIGGRTSGTIVSLLLSDGFEKTHIWDLGRYGIDDSLTLHSYLY